MDAPQPTITASPAAGRKVMAGGLAVVGFIALVKLVLHLATTGLFGYSFFVDELYLAWGFVDMPPLFPAITALIRAVLATFHILKCSPTSRRTAATSI